MIANKAEPTKNRVVENRCMRYPVERICRKPRRRSIVQEEKSMSEPPLDRSRRALMQVVVSALSAAFAFRMSQADASDKMTRQQAQYQDTPNGIYSCGLCTLFERPNACKVVEGEVSKDGWCKAFVLAD
jgi:hypothetical protein